MNRLKISSLFMLALIVWTTSAHEKRNYLTQTYSRRAINTSLVNDDSWVPYPAYENRDAWGAVPEGIRKKAIETGEKYIGYQWQPVLATTYLEFTRTGNRAVVDNAISTRLEVIRSLVKAELMEGKGRFLDDMMNGVFSFCEQTYWGMSATFYMYKTGFKGHDKPNTVLPDLDDPIVDLSAGDTAADLAWIWYFFHREFDRVNPVISKRLKDELQKKILDPFYERYDFWWITGWDEGNVNNWNPWCNYNILTCIALLENDPEKKKTGIYKTMASVDLFINSYPDDGGCDEGPSYWAVAGGKLFCYLDLLKKITNGHADIFDREIIKNIGRYIYRVYISPCGKGEFYVNFSDSPAIIRQDPGLIYRFGCAIQDPVMESFGAFLLEKSDFGSENVTGRIGEVLETLFNLGDWKSTPALEPEITEFYFPDRELVVARDKKGQTGFYFSAKGGNNSEGHNHNDVGSFILYYNGEPVLVDAGVGTYTRETFSSSRYNIWTMQSNYHNLPVINGCGQKAGAIYKARNSKFEAGKMQVSFSTDISGAYPPEAKLKSWVRSYTLNRGKSFSIHDSYQLTENLPGTALHFIIPLSCELIRDGILELRSGRFTLQMIFDPQSLSARIEPVCFDDQKIRNVWQNGLNRIVFALRDKKAANDMLIKILESK
ncbi:MAG: heparinase II/III family protein [Mangrovibacterium sp.]